MIQSSFSTVFFNDSFETALENMAFDQRLLTLHQAQRYRYFRLYSWKNAGITYSAKHAFPEELNMQDHASRVTGGGIVFHQPGDVLITLVTSLDDPLFLGKFKDKLTFFSQMFSQVLKESGIELDPVKVCKPQMHAFCAHYDSPYELTFEGKKVLGIAVRKWKTHWMVQGVLHFNETMKGQVPGPVLLIQLETYLKNKLASLA